jgi:hypothetical protein
MLSPKSWRRITSWICGWAYVVGNILITLAVNFGTTLFIVGCINVFETEDGEGISQAETYQVYLIFVALTLLCNLVSSLGNRWLPYLDVSHLVLELFFPTRAGTLSPYANIYQLSKRLLPFTGPELVYSPWSFAS